MTTQSKEKQVFRIPRSSVPEKIGDNEFIQDLLRNFKNDGLKVPEIEIVEGL